MNPYTNAITNQNAASTNWRNGPVPSMPGYGDPYDKPFDEMYTPEDQVHWLYTHLMRAPSSGDTSNLQEQITALVKRVEVLEEKFKTLAEALEELKVAFTSVATGSIVYDVTAGDYAPTMTVARRTWQGEAMWGLTVEDMAAYTVGDVATWGILAVAIAGQFLYTEVGTDMEQSARFKILKQLGQTYPEFNPGGYIRREELEQIDVENLQAGTIYGLPNTSLATPVGVLAPWKRRATVRDLNTSQITYNGHFVTEGA